MRSKVLLLALFLAVSFLALSFSSCMNKANAQGSKDSVSRVESESAKIQKEETPAPQINPQVEKLGRVLSSMSKRAKETIPNGNPDEFLADLNRVIEEDKKTRSDDLSLLYLIDKKHNVGSSYVPKDLLGLVKNDLYTISRNNLSLRPEAEASLRQMSQAALKDGIRVHVLSTYRSYQYQKNLFQHWVEVDGLKEAERESAREGTSQHQLGTAVDFGELSNDFASKPMGKWLYAHAADQPCARQRHLPYVLVHTALHAGIVHLEGKRTGAGRQALGHLCHRGRGSGPHKAGTALGGYLPDGQSRLHSGK